jgi:hypothetical protein
VIEEKDNEFPKINVSYDDILKLHPGWTDIHHGPNPNCPYCKGTGERHIKLPKKEMSVHPCICLFVGHEWVGLAQDLINQTIKNIKRENL